MQAVERKQEATAGNADSQRTRVIGRRIVASNVVMLELVPIDGTPVAAFSAGAHIELLLEAGARQYSLFNAPHERDVYRIAVRREEDGRGGSAEVFDRLVEGDTLSVRGPFNHFSMAADSGEAVLIAGGIGITPILAMAEQCRTDGTTFELHYAGRGRQHMAFAEQLLGDDWQAQSRLYAPDLDGPGQLDVAQVIPEPAAGKHLYVCGPAGLIEAVQVAARDKGWPESRVHFERFGADAPQPADGDQPFELEIASSGQRIVVGAQETAADALARAGVVIPTSCGSGVCGSCCTRIKEGTPDHRDLYFSPEEQARGDQFTPCCSRAVTAVLVLDL
ncbi:PDR/VanB family oxidoreductase [Marinobacter sp. JSM 1782161]|uniref:PDR/VanB family oxidoreductase n=1 Tax=Marinobacter sp. JSM 1782161 TaxID=2685906 RepID=UPI00140221B9|nr:PDR/VanB family oxidoreductase [Marinobacter sp. JSM 1782161]